MMLQGDSAADLQEKAKRVAAAGFQRVQVTFSLHPTADELKSLSQALSKLKLKTVALGTYFNQFRPDDTSFMHSDCKQFVTWTEAIRKVLRRNPQYLTKALMR